jgi:hypothetical protein
MTLSDKSRSVEALLRDGVSRSIIDVPPQTYSSSPSEAESGGLSQQVEGAKEGKELSLRRAQPGATVGS